MKKLIDSERHYLKRLCSCRSDDIMLSWFFEGNPYSEAWVNSTGQIEEAVVIAADFCYLLGNPHHPEEIERTLMEKARHKIIIPCGLQWVGFLNEYLSSKVYSYKRFAIKQGSKGFDRNHLGQLIGEIDQVYEIKEIDEDIYKEVVSINWAADGCCFFRSFEDFMENGIGYVVYNGKQLVCIASSYVAYKNRIGITIGTIEEHRRKGLAAACAASLILACLDKGIEPEWEAANMASVALSEKLGYQFDNAFDVYSLV